MHLFKYDYYVSFFDSIRFLDQSKYPFFDYEIYKLRIDMSLFRYAYIISDTLISQIPILNGCERRVSISTFNYC